MKQHKFGGSWTQQKLDILKKYLKAYSTIMNKQAFKFAYIDAFAGTGYRKSQTEPEDTLDLENIINDKEEFIKGSAKIALEVDPEFQKYIFIEKDKISSKELENLKEDFPDKKDKIKIVNADANTYIKKICNMSWEQHRAMMFLDPYGMEVEWDTIKAISKTKAIDLWILFPLGIGVNRILKKNGLFTEVSEELLNRIFGIKTWKKEFYRENPQTDFFNQKQKEKVVSLEGIGAYFNERLKSIFERVADNPAKLYNSKNNPLYLFCFCSGNPKGSITAVKIAQDILKNI